VRISLLERVSGRRERQKVGDQARPGRVCNQAASIGYGKEASVAAWNGFYCTNPSQPRRQLSFELFQSHKTSSIGIFACPRKSPYFRYASSGETLCNECSRRGNPMMRIKHGDEDYKQRAPAARLWRRWDLRLLRPCDGPEGMGCSAGAVWVARSPCVPNAMSLRASMCIWFMRRRHR
jgi:hypothetical protein